MYSVEEVKTKQRLAKTFRLSGRSLLDNIKAVQEQCNGIGAAWFPKWLRWLVTKANPSLTVVADIHDRRYSIGGAEHDRRIADLEFKENAERVAVQTYNKNWIFRHLLLRRANAMYLALLDGGKLAFNYTDKKQKKKSTKSKG